jgi:hypothetical protein
MKFFMEFFSIFRWNFMNNFMTSRNDFRKGCLSTIPWWSRFTFQSYSLKVSFQENEKKSSLILKFGLVLVIALRPQTPKRIRGGWSHFSDTSEPVDGNGVQNMVIVQSGFDPATFL